MSTSNGYTEIIVNRNKRYNLINIMIFLVAIICIISMSVYFIATQGISKSLGGIGAGVFVIIMFSIGIFGNKTINCVLKADNAAIHTNPDTPHNKLSISYENITAIKYWRYRYGWHLIIEYINEEGKNKTTTVNLAGTAYASRKKAKALLDTLNSRCIMDNIHS